MSGEKSLVAWQRIEALFILIASLVLYFWTGAPWLTFVILILVPDLSMLVLCFAATEPSALVANADHHDLNVLPTPVRITIDAEGHHTRVFDEAGPITEVRCAHPRPVYVERPATLQVYTHTPGGVRRYDERFEARSFRHQKRARSATLHDHPFFCGVAVDRLERPFLQWLCAPSEPVLQIATTPTRPVEDRP